MAVDGKLMRRFARLAGEELEGDWIVMGGGVLPLLGAGKRVTQDIDVAVPLGAGQDQTLGLMDIAQRLGLPVEAVNQAGAFFLRRIDGWQDHLVLVHAGPRARIMRPDATLYLLLKMGRMSESDLSDCLAFLRWSARKGEHPDARRLRRALASARAAGGSEARTARLAALDEALAHASGGR